MGRQRLATEQLVDRWEARREVKNLMGRMTQAILHKEESDFVARFWSKRNDVSLGVNAGWYLGVEAVRAYYAAIATRTDLSDEILRRRFPALMPAAGRALGQFDLRPLSSEIVEVAGDGQTAKGMWSYQGSDIRMTKKGPLSYWTIGVYAVDFIQEGGQWHIWHMLELLDIDCPCGEKWWQEPLQRSDEIGFKELGNPVLPPPTIQMELHHLWSLENGQHTMPECPAPYDSFSDTFSYGYGEVQ